MLKLISTLTGILLATPAYAGKTISEEYGIDVHAEVHHEAGSAGLPQFDLTTFPSQIFWLFVSFVVLYLFFGKKALPELSSVMENRRNLIESDLRTADEKRREMEKLQAKYEDSISQSTSKANDLLNKAKENAIATTEKSAAEFQKKSEKEVQQISAALEKAKDSARADLNSISAEIVVEVTKKVSGLKVTKKDALDVIESKKPLEAKAA